MFESLRQSSPNTRAPYSTTVRSYVYILYVHAFSQTPAHSAIRKIHEKMLQASETAMRRTATSTAARTLNRARASSAALYCACADDKSFIVIQSVYNIYLRERRATVQGAIASHVRVRIRQSLCCAVAAQKNQFRARSSSMRN